MRGHSSKQILVAGVQRIPVIVNTLLCFGILLQEMQRFSQGTGNEAAVLGVAGHGYREDKHLQYAGL